MFVGINKKLVDIETNFNIAGGLPMVCIPSGALRAVAGVVQKIAGAILTIVGFIAKHLCQDKAKWQAVQLAGQEYVIHGALNVLRGLAEITMGVFTFGFMNFLLLAEQGYLDNIGPYYPYKTV